MLRQTGRTRLAGLATALALVLCGALLVGSSRGAGTCTVDWSGGGDGTSWNDGANWSTAAVPAATDRACVAAKGGTLTIDFDGTARTVASLDIAEGLDVQGSTLTIAGPDDSTVARLTLSGGTLAGAGKVTATSTLSWTSGSMTGTGTTALAPAASATIAGGPFGSVSLHGGRTLSNQGSVTWSSGTIFSGEGAVVENAGSFHAAGNNSFSFGFGGTAPLFHNAATGTLSKTGGTATTTIGVAVDNDGAVGATTGTLALTGGDGAGTTSGSFGGSGGGRVSFGGGDFTLGTGAALTGQVGVSGGTVDVAGIVPANDVAQSGGSLGGTGTLNVGGSFAWTGGEQIGTGTTNVLAAGSMTIAGGQFGSVSLHGGRTLQNQGAVTWSSGTIFSGEGAVVENAGSFHAAGDNSFSFGFGGTAPLFHNAATGTLSKTGGAATTTIGIDLDNDGALQAPTGRLSLTGGDVGTTSGSFGGSGGGLVSFDAGTYVFSGGSFPGAVAVTSASVQIDGAVAAGAGSALTLSGGVIAGTGTLTVAGSFTWTGGEQTGTGTTQILGGGSMTIAGGQFSSVSLHGGRTLSNQGSVIWSSGTIFSGEGAVVENAGSFQANGDNNVSLGFGGTAPLFHNAGAGTLTKTTGTATTTIGIDVDNDGTVQAQTGTLRLQDADASATETGAFTAAAAGTLEFGGGTHHLGATSGVSAAGTILVSGGSVDVGGSYNVTGTTSVTNGSLSIASNATTGQLTQSGGSLGGSGMLSVTGGFAWSAGEQTGSGITRILAGAALAIAPGPFGSVSLHGGRTLSNLGTAVWSSGTIFSGEGAVIDNAGTLQATGDNTVSFAFGGATPLVRNTGTFTKAASSGTTTIGIDLDNDGTLEAQSGELSLTGGDTGTTTGSFGGGGAGVVAFDGGGYTLGGGASFTGTVALTSATVTVGGAVGASAASAVTMSGGALNGTGTLTVGGSFTWTGGDQSGTGTTKISAGGTLSIASAPFGSVSLHGGRTLLNEGAVTWASGTIFAGEGAQIQNAGSFQITGDNNLSFAFGGPSPLLHNTGTLTKTAGTGTTSIGADVENDGTLVVASGVVSATSGYVQGTSGTFETHIAGSTPGTGFGRLSTTSATLAGTLKIVTDPAFHPAQGSTFKVVTTNVGARSGTFATVTGIGAGSGLAYATQYGNDGVTLAVGTGTAPVANPQSVTTSEDAAKPVTLDASDAESDPLTYAIVAPPTHGTLSGSAPNLTYTPAANYNGADAFTFKANDGSADSNVATISITVTPVNDSPTCSGASRSTVSGVALVSSVACSDVEGAALTYALVSSAAHGTLSFGPDGSFTYTSAAGFSGVDSFTFQASDGAAASAPATVTITVLPPPNSPPVAQAQSVATNQDTALTITLGAADPNGDALAYTIVGGPAHGTLSGSGAARTYTPAPGYSGADSFTFKANDGALDSNVATVSIDVRHVNRAPVATGGSTTTERNIAVAVSLQATDPDGDPLTFTIVGSPAHGTLGGSGGTRTYTPANGYSGADSFTFRASDGTTESNVATVSITVTAPVTPPPPPPSDEPVPQKSEVVNPVKGKVLVQRKPGGPFVPLTDTEEVKFGVVFDTANGTLRLTVAKDTQGNTSSLDVTGGKFVAKQDKTLLTTLTLTGGDFGVCGKRKLANTSPPKKSVRHLWGNGKGRFRTKGRYSSATVRGTQWLTDDRCDGTLTSVKRGTVFVQDLVRHREVVVKAGRSYLAKP